MKEIAAELLVDILHTNTVPEEVFMLTLSLMISSRGEALPRTAEP